MPCRREKRCDDRKAPAGSEAEAAFPLNRGMSRSDRGLRQTDTFSQSKQIAREGGTVISALNAKDKPALDTGTQAPEIQ